MKVVVTDGERAHLIGWTDLPDDGLPEYVARLFGAASVVEERFKIVPASALGLVGVAPDERVVVVEPGQMVELLPRWVSADS